MALRFAGTCRCGAKVPAGQRANWQRGERLLAGCDSCAANGNTPTPANSPAPVNSAPANGGPRYMQAKFGGRCRCGAVTNAGDEIAYDRSAGGVVGCPSCHLGRDAAQALAASAVALGPAVEAALAKLTEEQRAVAAGWQGGFARLTATAGSGKTTTAAVLAARLVRDGTTPERVLLTSFTVKAAREIKERLAQRFGASGAAITCGTFHSLVRGWLVEWYTARGDQATVRRLQNPLDGEGKIDASGYDPEEAKRIPRGLTALAQRLLSGESLAPYLPGEAGLSIDLDPSPALADDYLGAVGWLAAHLIGSEQRDEIEAHFDTTPAGGFRGLPAFYRLLDRALLALGVSIFDQWLFWGGRLSQQDPAFPRMIGSRFDYVIIDEAQDNNLAQLTLATAIAQAGKGNLLLVGDVRQSVYAFRGAVPEYTVELEKHTGRPVVSYFLTGNFRSLGPVVELGNQLAAGQSWDFGPPAVAARANADVPASDVISTWRPADAGEEAAEVARFAAEVLRDYPAEAKHRPIAVLARTNAALGPVEVALLRGKIPYVVTRGCGFFSRREVAAALSYLRLAFGVGADEEVVRRAASTPSRRLGRTFATAVGEQLARGLRPVEALRRVAEKSNYWRRGAELADVVAGIAAEQDVASAVQRAVNAVAEAFEGTGVDGGDDSRLENLSVLTEIADGFGSTAELLTYAAQGAQAKEANGPAKVVTLSTVHGAKGLEYSSVVVVGAIVGMFPHSRAEGSMAQAEERRLEYVAVTRAADRLVISAPQVDRRREEAAPATCYLLAAAMLRSPQGGGPQGGGEVAAELEARHIEEAGLVAGAAQAAAVAGPTSSPASVAADLAALDLLLPTARDLAQARTNQTPKSADGSRFVPVSRGDFEELLVNGLGFDEIESHGQVVYTLALGPVAVQVYSTLPVGDDTVRDVGEDSIKVSLIRSAAGALPERALMRKQPYACRTRGWRVTLLDRIGEALDRVRGCPPCSVCGGPTVKRDGRERQFYGCVNWSQSGGCKGGAGDVPVTAEVGP